MKNSENKSILICKAEEFVCLNLVISGTISLISKLVVLKNPFIEEGFRINVFCVAFIVQV